MLVVFEVASLIRRSGRRAYQLPLADDGFAFAANDLALGVAVRFVVGSTPGNGDTGFNGDSGDRRSCEADSVTARSGRTSLTSRIGEKNS